MMSRFHAISVKSLVGGKLVFQQVLRSGERAYRSLQCLKDHRHMILVLAQDPSPRSYPNISSTPMRPLNACPIEVYNLTHSQ